MNLKYSEAELLASASKCKTRSEWRAQNLSHYEAALNRREIWLKVISVLPDSGRAYYEDAELIEHAKLFTRRSLWQKFGLKEIERGEPSHWLAARNRGKEFYARCCAHMPEHCYTDDELRASAKKFETRGAWKKGDVNCYQSAITKPVFDECVAHMRPAANPFASDYIIYAYEFDDRSCYVGLTFVPEQRKAGHQSRGPVFDKVQTGAVPTYKVLEDGLTCQQAIAAEERWQAHYAAQGWLGLHIARAGSLGSIKVAARWTKEAVLEDAKRFQTKQEWIDGSQGSYRTAKREGWFEEAAAHMPKRNAAHLVGRTVSVESREKMRQAKLGKKHSAAHRQKQSEGIKSAWYARRPA